MVIYASVDKTLIWIPLTPHTSPHSPPTTVSSKQNQALRVRDGARIPGCGYLSEDESVHELLYILLFGEAGECFANGCIPSPLDYMNPTDSRYRGLQNFSDLLRPCLYRD